MADAPVSRRLDNDPYFREVLRNVSNQLSPCGTAIRLIAERLRELEELVDEVWHAVHRRGT